jgi:hypothetical protein
MKMAGGCVAPQSRIDSDWLLPTASSARTALSAAHFHRNTTTPERVPLGAGIPGMSNDVVIWPRCLINSFV